MDTTTKSIGREHFSKVKGQQLFLWEKRRTAEPVMPHFGKHRGRIRVNQHTPRVHVRLVNLRRADAIRGFLRVVQNKHRRISEQQC